MKKKKTKGKQCHGSTPPLLDTTVKPCAEVSSFISAATPSGGCVNPDSGNCVIGVTSHATMFDSKVHSNGVAHVPKALSNCADRIRACTMAGRVEYNNGSLSTKKNTKKKQNKKKMKQKSNLIPITLPPLNSNQYQTSEDIDGTHMFVDGGDATTPRIQPDIPPPPPSTGKTKRPQINKPIKILSIRDSHLKVITDHLNDPNTGLQYQIPGKPSDIILIPRAATLETISSSPKKCDNLCNAFDAIENNYRESRTRGAKSNVIRDEEGHKYTTTGTQAPRNAPGIVSVHYALRGLNKFHLKRILKYFSQVEHLFEKYLDTEQVRLIHSAIELVKAKRFTAPLKGKRKRSNEARIYGGLASGINVYLQCHDDRDFTYSATSAHMRGGYSNDDEVITYFAFPRLGIAITLRPGDLLFFNTKEPHCISSRCKNDDQVYCTSLYLKSANLGLHDNSISLLPHEEMLLGEYYNQVN